MFKVDVCARLRLEPVTLFAWLFLVVAFAFLMWLRGKRALDTPIQAKERLYRGGLARLALVASFTCLSVTRVPIAIFVWRNEDELRAACTGPTPERIQDWGTFSRRSNQAWFHWGWVDALVIRYAPDGMDPDATIEDRKPNWLYGRWYYVIDD